jgi:hypothetical protein
MHGVLCHEVEEGNDDETKEAENDENEKSTHSEERVDLVLYIRCHLYATELARFLHGSVSW